VAETARVCRWWSLRPSGLGGLLVASTHLDAGPRGGPNVLCALAWAFLVYRYILPHPGLAAILFLSAFLIPGLPLYAILAIFVWRVIQYLRRRPAAAERVRQNTEG
jgi:hypothetical protein